MDRAGPTERQRWREMAEELAGLGYWRMDVATRTSRWSPHMYRIYGFDPEGEAGPGAEGLARIHPDDRAEANAALTAALSGVTGVTLTRVVWPDGTVRHTEGRIACERDADGAVTAIYGAVMDITERLAADAARAEMEAHLELLAANGGDLIIEIGVDRLVRHASQSFRRYGYDPASLVGRPGAELVHPDDHDKVRAIAASMVLNNRVDPGLDRTYRLRTADGAYIWVQGAPTLIHDQAGQITGVISVVRDITEERAAAERLAAREAQLRLISEHTRDVVIQYGLDREVLYVSPAARRYGYEPEDFVGRPAQALIHPDDQDKVAAVVAELFSGAPVNPDRDRTHRVRTASGDYIWVEGYPEVVRDAQGRPTSVVSLLHDITERHTADAALAESERRYRLLADNVTDIVSRSSIEGRFSYLSPSLLHVTGYRPDELFGKSLIPLIHPDDLPAAMAYYASAIDGTRPEGQSVVYRARHKSGDWIWLESNPTVLRDEAGTAVEFIAVIRDVSARHRMEEELRQARDAAEAAAAVKAEFMANMSHEIRTPLTAVLGFSSLISARTDLDPTAREHADRIAAAGRALLGIVNDVLDFSKLEAGQTEIKTHPVAPAALAREALDLFSLQAEAKGLRLDLELDPDLPAWLALDGQAVRQVLLNLLGNAVKFSEAGGVALALAYHPSAAALRVEVRDSGPGLDAEQAAKLFQRFSQVDGSSTRRHGGTGLGLAICKGLVEAMQGKIGVESTPGQGSTFRFTIPAPVAQAPLVAGADGRDGGDLDGVRLLVVDDNPINRELVRALLTPFGVDVTEAVDGMSALDLCAGQPFDLILLDVRMPGLSGHQVLERLRAEDGPNQDVPVLSFSADLEVDDAGAARFDGHISKPLDPARLITSIADWTTFEPPVEVLHADAV